MIYPFDYPDHAVPSKPSPHQDVTATLAAYGTSRPLTQPGERAQAARERGRTRRLALRLLHDLATTAIIAGVVYAWVVR